MEATWKAEKASDQMNGEICPVTVNSLWKDFPNQKLRHLSSGPFHITLGKVTLTDVYLDFGYTARRSTVFPSLSPINPSSDSTISLGDAVGLSPFTPSQSNRYERSCGPSGGF
jgi:hypothetical protein